MLEACWLLFVILKKICGINQAEDRVTWPDLLHRHTITLASFREWSVVSAWLRIRAQPRNPCQPRNSASASTCLLNEFISLSLCLRFICLSADLDPLSLWGVVWKIRPPIRACVCMFILDAISCQEFYRSYLSFISQCPRTGKFRGVWGIVVACLLCTQVCVCPCVSVYVSICVSVCRPRACLYH